MDFCGQCHSRATTHACEIHVAVVTGEDLKSLYHQNYAKYILDPYMNDLQIHEHYQTMQNDDISIAVDLAQIILITVGNNFTFKGS